MTHTATVTKTATHLLDLQLWCFGMDIRHPDENLMLAYGFSRVRAPETVKGSSRYFLPITLQSRLCMWGFGLFFGDDTLGGVYLKRYGFNPQLSRTGDAPQTWTDAPLRNLPYPRETAEHLTTRALLAEAFSAIAGYEAWISETRGAAYRQTCIDSWRNRRKFAITGGEIVGAWESLIRNWEY